jgi:hypothetical protein
MKALLVAYDFRELYKNLELKIVFLGMLEAVRNSQRPKFGRLKFLGLKKKLWFSQLENK